LLPAAPLLTFPTANFALGDLILSLPENCVNPRKVILTPGNVWKIGKVAPSTRDSRVFFATTSS
jgi:hypothetical protein